MRHEVRRQRVPPLGAHGVLMKNVFVRRIGFRRTETGHTGKGSGVPGCALATHGAPSLEVWKLGEQHRGLDRVQPAVETHFLVVILLGAPVSAQTPEPLGQQR